MRDREFLIWLYDRLVYVHGESEFVDYMWKLKSIINTIPPERLTPNTAVELVR